MDNKAVKNQLSEEKNTNNIIESKRGRKKGRVKNEKDTNYPTDIFEASKEYYHEIKLDDDNSFEEFKSTKSDNNLIKIRKNILKELENLSNNYSILNKDEFISMAIYEFLSKYNK